MACIHARIQAIVKRNIMSAQRKKQRGEAGYSLLEILIVLAIMGLLATMVAPRLFSSLEKSKVTAARAQAKSLRLALDSYRLDTGNYPTSTEGLSVLIKAPANSSTWYGPYLDGDTLPLDPWKSEFVYEAPKLDSNGRQLSPHVISLGADKALGGSGLNADVSS